MLDARSLHLTISQMKIYTGWPESPPGPRAPLLAAIKSAAAVRKAYKRAALRFHPDRTRALSVAERARGEEVWKALGSKMEAFERTAR